MPESYSVLQYVEELRAIHRDAAGTPETTFYPPVSRLFNVVGEKLKPKVLFISQLKDRGAGMPDGGFFSQPKRSPGNAGPPLPRDPDYGAVEIKPAFWSLDELTRSDQTARYLKGYGAVLITNLREFRLLVRNADGTNANPRTLERYVLATEADLWTGKIDAKHNDLLPEFLSRAMLYKVPLTEPKQVARLLASYAREARARAADHQLAALRNIKEALEKSLGIEFEGEKGDHFFQSTLVQTLFYGMFSAWVLWRHTAEGKEPNAKFNWRLADQYLRVPILRKLFRELADPYQLKETKLAEILAWAGDALNRVVDQQLFDEFQGERAVAYFYEPFLEAFDPQLRKELGVWYTPREIVQYQVERVDHLLRTELGQELGLASDAVRILDPCCGTGAYLTAVLERIHRTLKDEAGDDTAYVPGKLRTAALTRVFGFEIMPAPFVIAHMEIARLLEDAGAPLLVKDEQLGIMEDQRARIYLTNALTGWVPTKYPKSIFSELQEEREAADHIKQEGTILVILGNPPYNGYAGIALGEERDLTTAYRAPVSGLPAPQGQGLNNLYVRFFRMAERRIANNANGVGIVCFISAYSWLDGLSHPTMRHAYLSTFSDIYIDNLHGDRKISEYAPDGRTSETVFAITGSSVGIRVGTAVSTLVRSRTMEGQANLHYRDFDQARASERRLAMLGSLTEPTSGYSRLLPNLRLGMPFMSRVFASDYLDWPKLPELFPVSFPGIKTSRDALLVDIDKNVLERRMKRYFDPDTGDAAMAVLVPCAMESTGRFNASETRRYLIGREKKRLSGEEAITLEARTVRYAYRPFDVRWLYWEPETDLLDRKREDYLEQVSFPCLTIVTQQKSRGDSSAPQTISQLGCLDLLDRSASCFPSKVLPRSGSLIKDTKIVENLSEGLAEWAAAHGMNASDLFPHALAIMHTPQYRTENAGALLGDWPRIPLPGTGELLAQSAGLGRRLAELLDAESKVKLGKEWSFLARLRLPDLNKLKPEEREQANADALRLTAGWGSRGQGSTVMPGRGKVAARAWTAEERGKLAVLAAGPDGRRGLTLNEALGLLGEECVDVYLNVSPDGGSRWVGVPAKVWSYTLGGYQVLKKWLSYREGALLGRALREDEAGWFAEVARRVAGILLMGPELDASYRAVLPGAVGLAGPIGKAGNANSLRE